MEVQTKNREVISASTLSLDREEEFSRLMEHAPAYFAYLDPGLRYLFVSKQFEELAGIPRERLVGKLVSEIVGEESFALLKPQFKIALSGRAASMETFLPDYADRRRRLEHHIWPDVGSGGNV